MFPYTHICFAKDVLGDLNSEMVLGAIFPDTVIAGFVEHSDTHQQCGELHRYFTRLGIFEEFATAAVTHGTCPQGLDYYCDEKYRDYAKGYAFEMARPLVNKVVKCCQLPEKMGWWKAHNFIEMASELWLYQHRQDCHGFLARALDDKDLILALSEVLAPFYDISTVKMVMSFPIYGQYILTEEITPLKLAEKYSLQTTKKHGITIDVPGAATVIEEAVDIVNQTLLDFWDSCKEEIKPLVNSLRKSNLST